MNTGICVYDCHDHRKLINIFKKLGIDRTFLHYRGENFPDVVKLYVENGIICETIHSPFSKINDMWSEDEKTAKEMVDSLKDSIDICKKYNIPIAVVHLSSGYPMPPMNEKGIERFDEVFSYAKENGVIVALENQRFTENLSFFMARHETLTFCWDNGHEYGFTKGIRFMDTYGDRTTCIHIHDNRCGINTDDHLIPFDGNIDFNIVAKDLAKNGFDGTLMLEIGKTATCGDVSPYENMTDEEYIEYAFNAAKKLASMVDDLR